MIDSCLEKKPKVAVLLATHHPSKYIEEQINSLIAQIGVQIVVYWGDFDSTSEEKKLVRNLLSEISYFEYTIFEEGPAANFLYLLQQTKEDYVAFCDQDDIWLPNKLLKQVHQLKENQGRPSLTHSKSQVIKGERLRFQKTL